MYFVRVGTTLLSRIILTQSCCKALKGTTKLKQYFLCGHKIFKTNFQNNQTEQQLLSDQILAYITSLCYLQLACNVCQILYLFLALNCTCIHLHPLNSAFHVISSYTHISWSVLYLPTVRNTGI